ncbi:MAG: phosphoribosylformylglycinamidine synthase, partial [Planctomycetota bacterium]|nr:phosphoribosylformylglycinamidine synthase [Planctomycetota bacterium]
MVLAVPPENVERILKIFSDEGVEATVIGTYGVEGRMLRLFYAGDLVGEMEMDFLHEGLPRPTKEALYEKIDRPSPTPPVRTNYNDTLLKILSAPNVASKEWIIRQYDHEVQGGSVVKSLVGPGQAGPSDAAVIRPVLASQKGVVISCGMNPKLGELDPYQSALHAVDEALRNGIAVGGNLARTALLDNFCWG